MPTEGRGENPKNRRSTRKDWPVPPHHRNAGRERGQIQRCNSQGQKDEKILKRTSHTKTTTSGTITEKPIFQERKKSVDGGGTFPKPPPGSKSRKLKALPPALGDSFGGAGSGVLGSPPRWERREVRGQAEGDWGETT